MIKNLDIKAYISEFIGTFALVFCGTGSIVINDLSNGQVTHVGIAMTFGLIVMAMILTFGKSSGAHINPAVTIAFTVIGLFDVKKVPGYLISQITGGILASILLNFLFNHEGLGATLPSDTWVQTFVLELLLTYFLMLTVLMVSQNREISQLTAFAAGGVVLLEAMFAGPITGASMNPARSIAPALVSGNLTYLWIYIIAPTLGALIASGTWVLLKEKEA